MKNCFVISVDTPMVTGKAISALYQFLVSRLIEDQIDSSIPTIAFYHPNCINVMDEA